MIPEPILARIAHYAGVDDDSAVRLDVVSVYLLQALHEAGLLGHMAFKGGNALRKIFARKGTRFSRDLDFVDVSYEQLSDLGHRPDYYYYNLLEHLDDRTIHGVRWQLPSLPDEDLEGDTLRVDVHFFIYEDAPAESWEERTDNVLVLELSFRRPVLLAKEMRPLRQESWFRYLEFEPAAIQNQRPCGWLESNKCAFPMPVDTLSSGRSAGFGKIGANPWIRLLAHNWHT